MRRIGEDPHLKLWSYENGLGSVVPPVNRETAFDFFGKPSRIVALPTTSDVVKKHQRMIEICGKRLKEFVGLPKAAGIAAGVDERLSVYRPNAKCLRSTQQATKSKVDVFVCR